MSPRAGRIEAHPDSRPLRTLAGKAPACDRKESLSCRARSPVAMANPSRACKVGKRWTDRTTLPERALAASPSITAFACSGLVERTLERGGGKSDGARAVRHDPPHGEEAVDLAGKALVPHLHAGLRQRLGVGFAFVLQRIELRRDDQRRRQVAVARRQQR